MPNKLMTNDEVLTWISKMSKEEREALVETVTRHNMGPAFETPKDKPQT